VDRAQRIAAGIFAVVLLLNGLLPPPVHEQAVTALYLISGMLIALFALRPHKS
jgi:hypothetical protein